MDGVFFCRLAAQAPFAKALDSGQFSYCLLLKAGRLRFETDFPRPVSADLGPGDAVAISGLAPHVFSAGSPTRQVAPGRFERKPLAARRARTGVDAVLGVAPNEALALTSLTLGPIIVRAAEQPVVARRLWAAVAMLEDEYADAAWLDHDLVVRRLAEIMAINMVRSGLAARESAEEPPALASRNLVRALTAFLAAPERSWTLAELARSAGMSRSGFAGEFKLVTGHTPGRILSRMRLTAAARRLDSSGLTVEAAAEEAGYSSSAAFVRAFQREFGESPARWRRRRSGGVMPGAGSAAPLRKATPPQLVQAKRKETP